MPRPRLRRRFGAGVAKAADIKIAVVGPITGPNAAFGEQMKRGAEMAVKDINAKAACSARSSTLEVGDDACDPKQAVAVANDVVDKKVVFVAGHFCSARRSRPRRSMHEEGILQITPASTNPALTDDAAKKGWNNVFRVCGRDDAQGAVAGKYLAEHYKGKKIAIVHDKSAYGKGLADETKKAMNTAGLKEADVRGDHPGRQGFHRADQQDEAGQHRRDLFRRLSSRGRADRPPGARPGSEGAADRRRRAGHRGVLEDYRAGRRGHDDDLRARSAQGPGRQGGCRQFMAEGYNPEGYTLYTYAAIQAFKDAAEKAGSTDADKLQAQLHGHSFNTVLGPIKFDDKGDIVNPQYVFYVWSKGQYKEVGS